MSRSSSLTGVGFTQEEADALQANGTLFRRPAGQLLIAHDDESGHVMVLTKGQAVVDRTLVVLKPGASSRTWPCSWEPGAAAMSSR